MVLFKGVISLLQAFFFNSAMAFAGFNPFGQALVQFIIV
jgi:hypothetical protein